MPLPVVVSAVVGCCGIRGLSCRGGRGAGAAARRAVASKRPRGGYVSDIDDQP